MCFGMFTRDCHNLTRILSHRYFPGFFFNPGLSQLNQDFNPRRVESADVLWNDLVKTLSTLPALLAKARAKVAQSSGIKDTATSVSLEETSTGGGGSRRGGSGNKDGKLLMIYICNFHVVKSFTTYLHM